VLTCIGANLRLVGLICNTINANYQHKTILFSAVIKNIIKQRRPYFRNLNIGFIRVFFVHSSVKEPFYRSATEQVPNKYRTKPLKNSAKWTFQDKTGHFGTKVDICGQLRTSVLN